MSDSTKPQEGRAPDPSHNYERSHPSREPGMGRLDNNEDATPTEQPDKIDDAVGNAQDGDQNLTNDEIVDQRASEDPSRGEE